MEKRIIINADDFGLCAGVNKAVAKAHKEGVLTSATIMANMPAAKEAVRIAKKLPDLGVGVHLNLFEGEPLSKDGRIDCLLGSDGRFARSLSRLSLLSIGWHTLRNAIRTELAAQIQWVIDKGIKPTHLDSHKHIHAFPPIFQIVCDLARRFEIAAIRWCLEPKEASAMPWPLPSQGAKKRVAVVRTMAKINRMQDPRLLKNDALLGVTHLGKIDVNFFKAVTLYNHAQIAEVMTHPGLDGGYEAGAGGLLHQKKVEFEALCSERTKQFFEEARVKLVHYGQL
jgi:hopanoid biosynthesis associated protein HpnK